MAIRMRDYLAHDGSRPSLALRTDGLVDLHVVDAGDVEMYSGDIEVALPALEAAVEKVTRSGAIPVVLGGDHSIDVPGREGRRERARPRPDLDDPLRRARGHRRHRVRLAVGTRAADAPADRVRRAARRPFPADRAARLLAAAGHAGLDGRAADAVLRDDRDRAPRPGRVPDRGVRDRDRRLRRRLPVRRHRRLRPRPRPRHRDARARWPVRAPAAGRRTADLPRAARGRDRRGRGELRRTTTPTSRPRSANRVVLEALSAIARKRQDERDGTRWDPAHPLLAERSPRSPAS